MKVAMLRLTAQIQFHIYGGLRPWRAQRFGLGVLR